MACKRSWLRIPSAPFPFSAQSRKGTFYISRMAPTFGRLCAAIEQDLQRPNVGAAQPCEAIRVCLWRKRTDNWPILALEVATSASAKSRCYPVLTACRSTSRAVRPQGEKRGCSTYCEKQNAPISVASACAKKSSKKPTAEPTGRPLQGLPASPCSTGSLDCISKSEALY
jgi:hypothetical protein